jgi:hypothetical protein
MMEESIATATATYKGVRLNWWNKDLATAELLKSPLQKDQPHANAARIPAAKPKGKAS